MITRAFGIQLDTLLHPPVDTRIETNTTSGFLSIEITPPAPFPGMTIHKARLTPVTHRVTGVLCAASKLSLEDANALWTRTRKAVMSKLGREPDSSVSGTSRTNGEPVRERWSFGDRNANLLLTPSKAGSGMWDVELNFCDDALLRLGASEEEANTPERRSLDAGPTVEARPRSLKQARAAAGLGSSEAVEEYNLSILEAIKARWLELLDNTTARDPKDTGKAVIQFELTKDGHASSLKVLESGLSAELTELCRRAVVDPSPYPRWTSIMQRIHPTGSRRIKLTFTCSAKVKKVRLE